jgi:hypothetical protein
MSDDTLATLSQHLAYWEKELILVQAAPGKPQDIAQCEQMVADFKHAIERRAVIG